MRATRTSWSAVHFSAACTSYSRRSQLRSGRRRRYSIGSGTLAGQLQSSPWKCSASCVDEVVQVRVWMCRHLYCTQQAPWLLLDGSAGARSATAGAERGQQRQAVQNESLYAHMGCALEDRQMRRDAGASSSPPKFRVVCFS